MSEIFSGYYDGWNSHTSYISVLGHIGSAGTNSDMVLVGAAGAGVFYALDVDLELASKAGVSWLKEFGKKLLDLKNLPHDWNGYGSEAPNSKALKNMQDILYILNENNFQPARIGPSAEGGFALTFAKELKRAIIECDNDGDITAVMYEGKNEPNVWEVGTSESEIKESIERIYAFL